MQYHILFDITGILGQKRIKATQQATGITATIAPCDCKKKKE